jgi:beta-galactosidase
MPNRQLKNGLIFLALTFVFYAGPQQLYAQSNDHMFPAAPAAKKYIDFDGGGFLINGKRTFLVSAGLEYARIPHQLWYDRLLRLKRAGFNCVEIYTFWNFHEPKEDQWEFSGDQDLDGFLKTVKSLAMYAIVRVGPYYCAEWDSGGYPIWLRFKDSVVVRSPNAPFEKYMDRFFDKLMPIVNGNQINKGGAVILVQLENEHPASWGTYIPNDYFRHLQQKALSMGLEVPYFFSGLHHGSDPAGDKPSLDEPGRPNPWFTTEFWSVWYNLYGSTQKDADTYGRRTWKIIAHGGNGYNYYMAHGGTNFNYSNSHEDAASYDYGAAVGQTGDLRPIYYQFKRNALFARSFENILQNSHDAPTFKDIVTDTAIRVNTRHSDSGDIIFLDHRGQGQATADLHVLGLAAPYSLQLEPGEILPIVHNFKLTPNVTIDWALTRILGISHQGNTTTLVIYGPVGSAAELLFSMSDQASGSNPLAYNRHNFLGLSFDDQPETYSFRIGTTQIRILAVNTALADRTWFVGDHGKDFVVTGPEYISEFKAIPNLPITITTEHFWTQNKTYPTWIYGEAKGSQIYPTWTRNKTMGGATYKMNSQATPSGDSVNKPYITFTGSWLAKSASTAAAINFDDSNWKKSEKALEMGADGDITANAWYRTKINVPGSGIYKLNVNKGGGRFIAFIDDQRVAAGNMNELQFNLSAGPHQLALFAAHDGRDKLYSYIGRLQDVDVKGIAGDIALHKGKSEYLTDWKMIKLDNNLSEQTIPPLPPSFDNAVPYRVGSDPFNQQHGFAWFQTTVPVTNGRIPLAFNFRSVDDRAVVFVNGKQVATVDEWNKPFIAPYDGSGAPGSAVVVTVFLENRNGAGGIDKPVEILFKDDILIKDWRMKGGPGDMDLPGNWTTIKSGASFDRPYFFKNTFRIANNALRQHPMWRVSFEGLSHGFIFINGHNIGGYPERVPIGTLYIPECWLHDGENSIVVYDQYGNRPDRITIQPESAASRSASTVTAR